MNFPLNRRQFLQQSVCWTAGLLTAGARVSFAAQRSLSPNEKLNIGIIGVAHQGNYDLSNVADQNIVALCDVNDSYLAETKHKFPSATTYNDFRRLLDQKDIEAVVVATPDHTHAVATFAALRSGKHVYCEKPLTRTISECRKVMEAARESKRATQIGTQIHAGSNYRRVVELVQSGAVGPIDQVHVWVNASYGAKDQPAVAAEGPHGVHYDLWLGPVPERPYSPDYLPVSWRNWWAFGGGALADFGCHYMDLPHWALGLRACVSAEVVEGPPVRELAVPPWLIVRYQYPARQQQPPVTLTWYHGGKQPWADVLAPELAKHWSSGVLFIGTKGQLLADYGRHSLLPEKDFAGFNPPPRTIPESIGHHAEWVRACKTGGPTTCNFEYSGALTETVLLGNVAYRAGKKLEWDTRNLKAKGVPEADRYIHHEYRKGWKI
jgi:predicted dehydrogenase